MVRGFRLLAASVLGLQGLKLVVQVRDCSFHVLPSWILRPENVVRLERKK